MRYIGYTPLFLTTLIEAAEYAVSIASQNDMILSKTSVPSSITARKSEQDSTSLVHVVGSFKSLRHFRLHHYAIPTQKDWLDSLQAQLYSVDFLKIASCHISLPGRPQACLRLEFRPLFRLPCLCKLKLHGVDVMGSEDPMISNRNCALQVLYLVGRTRHEAPTALRAPTALKSFSFGLD
jgi:hypothetical protein